MFSSVRHHPLQALRLVVLHGLFAAIVVLLQGCGTSDACSIDDIYKLIQIDGRTGLSKNEVSSAGVKLCARHLRKEETYADDACVGPEQVFFDGKLPTLANGDSNALLLVWCPTNAYPQGKELQRVTCSEDYLEEDGDGEIQKALQLRFDNYEHASNCLLGGSPVQEADAKPKRLEPVQVLESANQSHTTKDKTTASSVNMAGKVMRSGDVVAATAPFGSHELLPVRAEKPEVLVTAAAAAATSDEERAKALAQELLGPDMLSMPKTKVGNMLAKIDVSVEPHGSLHMDAGGRHHRHHKQAGHRGHHGHLFRTEAVTEPRE